MELRHCQIIPIAAQIMSRRCLRCRLAHVKCESSGENLPCHRCNKFLFTCEKSPLLVPPPPPSPLPMLLAPPPLAVPHWTHRFGAPSNSSNRVRAAAIAFLAEPVNDPFHRARIKYREEKKTAKQKKFLKVVHYSNIDSLPLSLADIKNDVIVFDGTASFPPPPISSPLGVSIINTFMYPFFY